MNPSNKNKEVLVLDSDGKYLLPTSAALARKLLKEGKAKVTQKDPFVISLNKNVESPNIQRRYEIMKASNLHEYFREPKAVYVQNISDPIGVISLTFKKLNGEIIPCPIPDNRNPVVLTDRATFEEIRDSMELRSFLRGNSYSGPKLMLLTEDEFKAYYERRAKEMGGVDPTILANQAQEKTEELLEKSVKIVTEDMAKAPAKVEGTLEPEVNPRILSICQQLDPSNPAKISARDALETLTSLRLNELDYQHILSNCYDRIEKGNAIIRKWVLARLNDMQKEPLPALVDPVVPKVKAQTKTQTTTTGKKAAKEDQTVKI